MPDGNTPASINPSPTARTRSSISAKMLTDGMRCIRGFVTDRVARLTQFRSRVKEPRMFGERITIRHAGDEIGDMAGALRLVEPGKASTPFRRHVVRLGA